MKDFQALADKPKNLSSPIKPMLKMRWQHRFFNVLQGRGGAFSLADSILTNKLRGVNMYWKRYGTFCLVIIALFVVGCSPSSLPWEQKSIVNDKTIQVYEEGNAIYITNYTDNKEILRFEIIESPKVEELESRIEKLERGTVKHRGAE